MCSSTSLYYGQNWFWSYKTCDKSAHRGSLTGWEATSKEHVEEVFRSDVGLKASVEVKSSAVRVTRAARLLSSRQVILPSLVWVAQHCICITNL